MFQTTNQLVIRIPLTKAGTQTTEDSWDERRYIELVRGVKLNQHTYNVGPPSYVCWSMTPSNYSYNML